LTGELRGTVQHIGLQVQRQNIINTDPSANKVHLDEDSSQKVAGSTNMQVKVAIGESKD
jgi:HlyD family secretion protein